mmetsp:Transcript_82128/g.219823  ORF Transcript_82128/g.219823 Transcript_82128/m.219823 type:complete len:216 (+) Transcript_82128:51-698(+)
MRVSLASVVAASAGDCLCIFDIDRTLTGSQGSAWLQCRKDARIDGVHDSAYAGGTLVLSEVSQFIAQTFCSQCYIGTISAGSASGAGSAERGVLHDKLALPGHLPTTAWSACSPVTSPLVTGCPDGTKQNAVGGIVSWYQQNVGASIANGDVHFYDDRADNVKPFASTGYNARQISCSSRDSKYGNAIGLCGAEVSEIVPDAGVQVCGGDDALVV